MPAIITHDQFGQEALRRSGTASITGTEKRLAFRLGNQGPDPLFYCVANPAFLKYIHVGNLMHDKAPAKLLANMARAARTVPAAEKSVAQAYAAGFLCHYLLDRTAHPLVYFNQYSLCGAGIEGLEEQDGSDVHSFIETELDEMMLYTRTGHTIKTYVPYKEILQCSDATLNTISGVVGKAILDTYELETPDHFFYGSVYGFRRIQHLFYSPQGMKREVLARIERLFRRHSFTRAISHEPKPLTQSLFDNSEHLTWENPFTHAQTNASFLDLFELAQGVAEETIPVFLHDDFDEAMAQCITGGLNFSGKPVED